MHDLSSLPDCCFTDATHALDQQMYAAYNRGGDPATAGLNYTGAPCPTWHQLPDNVRAKWGAAATAAHDFKHPMITLPADTSFGAAIRWLKQGHKVSRSGWNGKGMWIALQVPDAHSKMGHPYPYMKAVDGSFFPWTPNVLDVMADDWGIVEFSFESEYAP